MTLYLLTAVTDHEGEDPVFLSASLEDAKAAAVLPDAGGFPPDGFTIYEAELGAKPVRLLDNWVRSTWDPAACRSNYALTEWRPA